MGCPSRPRCPGGGLDLTPQGRIHFRGLLGEPVPPALQLLGLLLVLLGAGGRGVSTCLCKRGGHR